MKFQGERTRLKNILAHTTHKIRFNSHALDEMANDDIIESDVRRMLTNGQVTWFEKKKDDIVHVEGKDVDGRRIRVVVGSRDMIKVLQVITVMERKT